MKPAILLRAAAAINLLFFAGHTAGYPWTPATGPLDKAVIAAMQTDRFDVAGVSRTYWDFYMGFGVAISIYLLAQALVLWQLASIAKSGASRLRPILATIFVAFVANAFVAWKYFFAVPAVMGVVVAVLVALAFATARGT